MDLLEWDVYEVGFYNKPIEGLNCRSRVRRFTIEKGINFLADHSADVHGKIRFAVLAGESVEAISKFLAKEFPGIQIEKKQESVQNPVLSALFCNELQI